MWTQTHLPVLGEPTTYPERVAWPNAFASFVIMILHVHRDVAGLRKGDDASGNQNTSWLSALLQYSTNATVS